MISRAAILTCFLATSASAQYQLRLSPIEQLPNAPTTYQMRDWQTVATNFDNLAFNVNATGQHLPLVRIDNTPASSQLQTSFGLPAYVGDMRLVGSELIHESLASLGAVLGGTLVGIDKTTGPYNWVAMTREYYVDRNSQYIVLNKPLDVSGGSAWYETFPSILFYSIADRYPGEATLQTALNRIDLEFMGAVDDLTDGGTNPNFNYTAYNFATEQPVYNGQHREPDMGLGMAWLQHAAYQRNRESNPIQAAAHLTAVDWALAYYETSSSNPNYEVLTSFGAYAAARMNAEHDRNFDIHKYLDWVFSPSDAREDLVMISGEQWGGQDVGGLLGTVRPNKPNVQGYAFAMNTYANAMPVVPLVRYEDRYSRAIGKWMLNAASAARLFYGNAHSPQNQSSESWTGDPQHSIAYEGLRHNWRPGEPQAIYAAGDPLVNPGWGEIYTDWGIYGSAFTGVFGSIIKTTNVDKILQLDLLATDFYRDAAHDTFLYYNPYATAKSVAIDLGDDQLFDLYDAASNRFLTRGVSGNTNFDVPSNDAVMLVKIPAGGRQTFDGRRMLVDGVVVDYNAALLPGNLVRNADVDTADVGNSSRPGYWHYSQNAEWSTETAVSPTHSLKLADDDVLRSEEWRSHANVVPAGSERTLQLRWFWDYDTTDEFHARLRLSPNAVSGVDLINPSATYDFIISGSSNGFELFETALAIPDNIQSFDLTFVTGGLAGARGTMFIDDISASLLPASAFKMFESDFNGDGNVDGMDLAVWQQGYGSNFNGRDFLAWQRNYRPGSSGLMALNSLGDAAVPEPHAIVLALTVSMPCLWLRIRRTCRTPKM